jgi:hypothetical protein
MKMKMMNLTTMMMMINSLHREIVSPDAMLRFCLAGG